jgi:hypothetical protein
MPARLAQAGLGVALLLATAGCEKHSPHVTVVTNGHTVHVAASNYCFGGKTLGREDECPADGPKLTTVKVRAGDTVRIEVDEELTHTGWVIYDPLSKQNGAIHNDDHLTIPVALGKAASAYLEVHQVTGGSDLSRVLGIWRFQLVES